MPTIIHTLEESNSEDYKILQNVYTGIFLEGECYAFALALNEGLGWPLVGLIKKYDERSKKHNVIWHAGVRSPDGRIHDVRRFLTEKEFGEYFLSPPFIIRDIHSDELYATRPLDDLSIKRAEWFAQSLWPELPWINTHAMKVGAFANELETLSRKYGLWICGSVPAQPPRLFIGGGEEGGYRLHPSLVGGAYSISRYFPFELKLEEASRVLR